MAVQTEMKLHDLDPIKSKLAPSSDELTVAIEAIQKSINDKQLGVEAYLDRGDHYLAYRAGRGDDGFRDVAYDELGYGKDDDGNWGLVVRHWEGREKQDRFGEWEHEDGEYEWVRPLLKAPRKIRAEAVEHIPALIEAIHDAAQQLLDRVEKAKQLAKELE